MPHNIPRLSKIKHFISIHKKDILVLGLCLIFVGLVHGINMTKYPYFENDEATYTSRAWSLNSEGALSPYTYWYDQAPFGWMLISFWQVITFKDAIFSDYLVSGRVLMLLLKLGSVALLYTIARKIKIRKGPTAFIVLLFGLNYFSIYFGRRVLLDNIMTFGILSMFAFLILRPYRVSSYVWSGMILGLVFLTKLNGALLYIPAMYLIYHNAHRSNRRFALSMFTIAFATTAFGFILYAILKSELLPTADKVSLVSGLRYQSSRGDFIWFWKSNSHFVGAIKSWYIKDIMLPILSVMGILWTLLNRHRNKYQNTVIVTIFSMLLFLIRGRLVTDFYLLSIFPFFCLAIGFMINDVFSRKVKVRPAVSYVLLILLIPAILISNSVSLKRNEVANQFAAIEWIKQNVPKNALMPIDNYAYPELAIQNNFSNSDYFFMIQYDKDIRKYYANDWRNAEYMLLTHELVSQMKQGFLPDLDQIMKHSTIAARFTKGSSSYLDLKNLVSTNGDWAIILKVKPYNRILSQDIFQIIKKSYFSEYGKISPDHKSVDIRDAAKYLQMAVEEGSRTDFEGVLAWSEDHLRHRSQDSLFSSQWGPKDGAEQVVSEVADVNANVSIATSLFKAHQKWPNQKHLDLAKQMITDIKKFGFINLDGNLVQVTFGTDKNTTDNVIRAYEISPASYRIFGQYEDKVFWDSRISEYYKQIEKISNAGLWSTYQIDIAADGTVSQSSNFNFNQYQLLINIAQDSLDSEDPAPKVNYEKFKAYFNQKIVADNFGYIDRNRDGSMLDPAQKGDAGISALGALYSDNIFEAKSVYNEILNQNNDKMNFESLYRLWFYYQQDAKELFINKL